MSLFLIDSLDPCFFLDNDDFWSRFCFLKNFSLRIDFKDFSFSGNSFKFVLLSLRIECVFSIDFS